MKMKYLIDVNVFLHSALEQKNQGVCQRLLDKVSEGKIDSFTTFFHLDSAAVIMLSNGMSESEVGDFYFEAYSSKGLKVINTGVKGRLNSLADEEHSGMDDSLILQVLNDSDVHKVVTYDTDFDDDIRISPDELLEELESGGEDDE